MASHAIWFGGNPSGTPAHIATVLSSHDEARPVTLRRVWPGGGRGDVWRAGPTVVGAFWGRAVASVRYLQVLHDPHSSDFPDSGDSGERPSFPW